MAGRVGDQFERDDAVGLREPGDTVGVIAILRGAVSAAVPTVSADDPPVILDDPIVDFDVGEILRADEGKDDRLAVLLVDLRW